jgi:N-acetylmuramoyl-L-alanine amidase
MVCLVACLAARLVRNRGCTRRFRREDETPRPAPRKPLRTVALALAMAGMLAAAGSASSAAGRRPVESPYMQAQRARQSLEAKSLHARSAEASTPKASPDAARLRRDYDRVLDLYRAVYHDNPASPKADASIFAVAQLLAERGRLLQDEKSLHDAVGQYEFLRREYPGSRYRADALLAEGDIYLHDLNDPPAAKATYQAFLKQHPHSPLAAQARADLRELRAAKHPPSPAAPSSPQTASARGKRTAEAIAEAVPAQAPQTAPPSRSPGQSPQPVAEKPVNPAQQEGEAQSQPKQPVIQEAPALPAEYAEPPRRKGKLVQVTGVRHWSTSIYTRVAIDLGDEVQYEAARVPDPDRIFFDLHGTKLSPELIGKSVSVTDDGFLKRIRVAQFSNDVTRIVLDVSDVSDYSAFLLPNPYRLIIDIHGRKPGTAPMPPVAQAKPPSAASGSQPNPPPASSATAPISPQPAPTQATRQFDTAAVTNPTAPASETASARDIASLGHQPDRVKATSHPTTAPIAASVAGTTPASQPEPAQAQAKIQPDPARGSKRRKTAKAADSPADAAWASIHEADPTADGGRSMVRALGLKIGRIVVDAGHGGHDSGTLGPDGIEEKDVVLDVSLRLGKLLKQRLGADVIFTRADDTFIPLETRTAIANKAQADLFVSVHANSSSDPSARGVETYYLNFTSSPESLELAARENAVSQQSIHQLSDLVKKIALHDKIDESREFASDVQKYLYEGLDQGNPGLKDRGVKQAPFVVLIGANMPSILAEISFLTNPDDARQLRDPSYRERIAESLYRGVARYISGLSGVRLAENSTHPPGN